MSYQVASQQAVQAAVVMFAAHSVCVGFVMHMDLSGKWAQYSLNRNRLVSTEDYKVGMKSFAFDLVFLFLPFMTFCFWYRANEIAYCPDSILLALGKLALGYILGKFWAFAVHYVLHFPSLYRFHRRHHRNPRSVVAAAAWKTPASSMPSWNCLHLL